MNQQVKPPNKNRVFKIKSQKHPIKLQKMKNTKSKIKLINIGKRPITTYCFGCKDFTHNFRPQEVKMTNKVFREKKLLLVGQISQGF